MPQSKSPTTTKSNKRTGSTKPVQDVVSLLTKNNKDGLRKSKEFTHLLEKCNNEEKIEVFDFIMGHLNMDGNPVEENNTRPLIKRNIYFLQEQEIENLKIPKQKSMEMMKVLRVMIMIMAQIMVEVDSSITKSLERFLVPKFILVGVQFDSFWKNTMPELRQNSYPK